MKEWADRGGAFAEQLLFDLLGVAKAWEMLHSPEIGHLDTEAYYELCQQAGYSDEASARAARDWANKRLAHDLPI